MSSEKHLIIRLMERFNFKTLLVFSRLLKEAGQRRRRQFGLLWIFMFSVGLFESLSTVWIAFYASLLTDPGTISDNVILAKFSDITGLPIPDGTDEILIFGSLVMASLIVLKNVARGVSKYMTTRFSAIVEAQFGERILATYLLRPYSWFLGKDQSQLQQTAQWRRQIGKLLLKLLQALTDLIVIVSLFATLILYNPVVNGPIIGSLLILAIGVFLILSKKIDRVAHSFKTMSMAVFKDMRGFILAYKDIRIYGAEAEFQSRFRRRLRKLAKIMARKNLLQALPALILESLGFLIMAVGTIAMILILDAESKDALSLMALLGVTAWRVLPAINRFLSNQSAIRSEIPLIDTVLDEIEDRPTNLNKMMSGRFPKSDELEQTALKSIRFENVSYRYPSADSNALTDVTFDIESGKKIGIIGSSGSGKTTIVDILSGLLEPTSGAILINGIPSKALPPFSWVRNLAYLPQKITLLNETLAGNIAFGIPEIDLDLERIKSSCHSAAIDDMWERFSSGEEMIGDLGTNLSGGQAQRVGIARLFYRNATLWIIDEGTASLDQTTEGRVLEKLFDKDGTHTIIMITHRLETLKHCDIVIWLEDGRIASIGRPDSIVGAAGMSADVLTSGENKD